MQRIFVPFCSPLVLNIHSVACSTFILVSMDPGRAVISPSQLYSDSAKCVGPHQWNIPQGHAVHEFITANGIHEIVQYNWYHQKTARNFEQYVRLQPVQEPHPARNLRVVDLADTMSLTDEGRAVVGRKGYSDVEVYKLVLRCTGKGHNVPKREIDVCNCQHRCGGLGHCVDGCEDEKVRYHGCSVRINITRTLGQVQEGVVQVSMHGSHVPAGETPIPPALTHLRIDTALARNIKQDSMLRGTSVHTAIQALEPSLSQSASSVPGSTIQNSRFYPNPKVCQSMVAYGRRIERGGVNVQGLDDWERANQLVRQRLIQRNVVLQFNSFPEGIVVLANQWGLDLTSKCGRNLVATDAKHDTTEGCKSMFSGLHVPTEKGWFATAVSITRTEDTNTITAFLDAVARNMPCQNPACLHEVEETFGEDGSYSRRLRCRMRTFSPAVAVDKHNPSFNAVEAAQFGPPLIDAYHGFK